MADLRVKDFPDAPAPADTDEIPLDGAAGVRSITWANLKQRVLEAIHAATITLRGGVKLTTNEADPKVYPQAAADARFAQRPVPVADLPDYAQYAGPSLNNVTATSAGWLRVIKWPAGAAVGGFAAGLSYVNGEDEYEVSANFCAGFGTLMVRNGSRGPNTAPAFGLVALRLVRKAVAANWEVYLEVQAGSAGFSANVLRVLLRSLLDGSTAGTTRPVIEFSAPETIGGAITIVAQLQLHVSSSAGASDYITWGMGCSTTAGVLQSIYLTNDGRFHLNDARTVGIQAATGQLLQLFALNKLWAAGGTDGRTVTPSLPALPRLVRGTITPAASVAFTHNLNTTDPGAVSLTHGTTGATTRPDTMTFGANAVTLTWASPPAGSHNIVVIG